MVATSTSAAAAVAVQVQAAAGCVQIGDNKESLVDSFLVEALQNPRHRLTILRMELDIQRFLQNAEQQQFEFQHFPTSYLRLAAHRVAQHYGLVTMVQDNGVDGQLNKIVVRKTGESSRCPSVRLSGIPAKQSDGDQPEKVKIAIRPRPNNAANGSNDFGLKRSPVRSVEERKEEYDRARARIFSCPGSPSSDDVMSQGPTDKKVISSVQDESEGWRNPPVDPINIRDGSSSRVAIFRDREKDCFDPDYDRSYMRYGRGALNNQCFNMLPFNVHKVQMPYIQYETGFPQLVPMVRNQGSLGYGHPAANPVLNPYCAVGANQMAPDAAAYAQWPSASMMYAHSYDQFRHAVFQAPFCQQPLTFDYSQNH
ncbi:unnamed protein product [Linum tenue]|uniref:Single-stranded nucleic acid binding R3H protein n=1 Tax=Linum tenue TaxID=586396 RepID=A0AAV0GQ71_9ROSI|nr:unnamed protein product [Linum tenue]